MATPSHAAYVTLLFKVFKQFLGLTMIGEWAINIPLIIKEIKALTELRLVKQLVFFALLIENSLYVI